MSTSEPNLVLVGVGDASDGAPELDWAAREAQLRNCVVHVVRAWQKTPMALPWEDETDALINLDLHRAAETRLRSANQYLGNKWPSVRVEAELIEGAPARVLTDCSEKAELTVLGSRRLGSIGSVLLGSVATVVAARAHSPIVVVRGSEGDAATKPAVIVGVDGSAAMHAVMSFAMGYASRHDRPVRVAFCYSASSLAASPWRSSSPLPERAERWLAEVTAGWQEKYPDVDLERIVSRDHPIPALIAESRGQDLLVVGSHAGRGRIASLLGSVSQGVLHHATCPVAIIPLRDTK